MGDYLEPTPRGSRCRSGAATRVDRVEPAPDGTASSSTAAGRTGRRPPGRRRHRARSGARTCPRSPAGSTRRSASSTRTTTTTRASSRTARSSSSGCPIPAPTSPSRPRRRTGRSCRARPRARLPVGVDTAAGARRLAGRLRSSSPTCSRSGRRWAARCARTSGKAADRSSGSACPTSIAAGVERHDAKTVGVQDGKPVLADGTVLDVANVIWCTGYRRDYSWIGAPVMGPDG